MSGSWKLSGFAAKTAVQAALLAHDALDDWDGSIVVLGREVAEDRPDDWVLEAFLERKPTSADRRMIGNLFDETAPEFTTEKLLDEDWLSLSQQGLEPIRAGRFYIRTPDYPQGDDGTLFDLVIPAAQAFGTGSHATTAGCVAMLTAMRQRGVIARNIADIGSGTGLLAFAAHRLWPRALLTATDIDPVCAGVMRENAELNAIALGSGAGQVLPIIADGMADPLIEARGPYDLLIANILAAPLIDLAPDFGTSVVPGGSLLLAGLLETQEHAVRSAMRRNGFRIAQRMVRGDWSILWLRKRR